MRTHPVVVVRAAQAGKARLLTLEQQTAHTLASQYTQVKAHTLTPAITRLTSAYADALDEARASAEEGESRARVPLHWLVTSGSALRLKTAIRSASKGLAGHVEQTVTHAQTTAAVSGATDAASLVHTALAPAGRHAPAVKRADPNHVAALAGTSRSRGHGRGHSRRRIPLREVLSTYTDDAAAAAERRLYLALSMGEAPSVLARDLVSLLDGLLLSRALTISRTELLNSYRDAASLTYRANTDVLDGWIWLADLGPRSCALCIALNGTEHSLDEDMDSHANCRCTQVPKTKGWDDILSGSGIDASDLEDTRPDVPSGSDWFADQDAGLWQAVLGKAGAAAYEAGDLSLDDLIGQDDAGGYYLKSLKDAGINWRDYLD